MKEAFTGELHHITAQGHTFFYSPCLHIQTFRVAETYSDKVKSFKKELRTFLKK